MSDFNPNAVDLLLVLGMIVCGVVIVGLVRGLRRDEWDLLAERDRRGRG